MAGAAVAVLLAGDPRWHSSHKEMWVTGVDRYPAANAGLFQRTDSDGAGFEILDYARRP